MGKGDSRGEQLEVERNRGGWDRDQRLNSQREVPGKREQ